MKECMFNIVWDDLKILIPKMEDDSNIAVLDNFNRSFKFLKITNCCLKFDFLFTIFVLEGAIEVQVDDVIYPLNTNDWIVVLKGQKYQTLKFADNSKIGICCFKNRFLYMESYTSRAINLFDRFLREPVISFSKEEALEYLDVFRQIKKYANDDESLCRTNILEGYRFIIFLLIYDIVLGKEGFECDDARHKMVIYRLFIRCVEEYYREERAVGFYADKLGFSPQYLSSVIYQISGKHAYEWLKMYVESEIRLLYKEIC